MKTPSLLILLVIAFTSCKKENVFIQETKDNSLKSISSVNYGYKEDFNLADGLLSAYYLDVYGTGAVVYEIDYDSERRASSIKKNGNTIASFYYNLNTVSLYVDDGLVDSLFYTINEFGKISSLEKFDDFQGEMLKNAYNEYRYSNNNLVEMHCTEYNSDASVKLNYSETAIFDNGKKAFEPYQQNAVLLEFLFQHIPSRVFTAHSQNNITYLESTHPSDGYNLSQSIDYNSLGYPADISYTKDQYGYVDQDIELYAYHE